MEFDFSWFIERETSRALATTFIMALAGLGSAWLASINVSRTIKNQNKGLPPEILRLEKIQTIIAKHEESTKTFQNIDISDLKGEYEKSLRKLFLETKLSNIGVENEVSRKKLLIISERPIVDSNKFPNFSTISTGFEKTFSSVAGFILTLLIITFIPLALFCLAQAIIELFSISKDIKNAFLWIFFSIVLFVLSSISYSFVKMLLQGWSMGRLEADLIARNVYQLNSELFTGRNEIIKEDLGEFRKRIYFENSRFFQDWLEKNPEKSSWEYGISSSHEFDKSIPTESLPNGYSSSEGRFFVPEVFSISPSPIKWIGWKLKCWESISLFPKGKKPQKISKPKNTDEVQ